MTDPSASTSRANDLPEPEQTGTQPGSQKSGSPDITVLPPATNEGGLYQTNVSEMLLAATECSTTDEQRYKNEFIDEAIKDLLK